MKSGGTVPPARGLADERGGRHATDEQPKRESRLALAGEHVPLLYRFVRHEIAYLEALGDLDPGALTAEDVVDAMLLRAEAELARARAESPTRAWLIRRAREYLQDEVKRVQAEGRRKVYLEIDSSELPTDPAAVLLDQLPYFYEPNELNVEEVVPDPGIPTPDLEAQRRELWACASRVLAKMPSDMRQGLLLYHVEGLMATELAEVLDKPVYDIPPLLDRARKDYRECLIAAGCRLKHEPGQKP